MAFIPSRPRSARPARERRVVLAVGRRVFVNCPLDASRPVLLTDEHGIPATIGLRDGVEVEVLAWRPRGSAGTRYRVRDRSEGADGVDGWLAADELRTTAIRPAPETTPTEPTPAQNYGGHSRPFGSRA